MSNFRKNAVSVYTDLPSIYFERKVQEECSIGICRLIFHIFQSVSVYTDLPSIYLCQYWYILTYFRAVSRRDRNQINKKGSLKYSRKYGREAHTYLPQFLYCNFSYYCIQYLKCMGWPEIIVALMSWFPWVGFFLIPGERSHFVPLFDKNTGERFFHLTDGFRYYSAAGDLVHLGEMSLVSHFPGFFGGILAAWCVLNKQTKAKTNGCSESVIH